MGKALSSGRSLSLPLVIGVIIIVAIVTSSLTYYYASLNLPTVTSQTTITSTTTATKSVTMTETGTVTVTKTVTRTTTLPPSTITLTVTTASTTTPSGKLIVIPRNDTAAQRLAEFRLKYDVLTSVIVWLVWMEMRSRLHPLTLDPAAALANNLIMRLTSRALVTMPPLTSRHSIKYVISLIPYHPTQTVSNGTCMPIDTVESGVSENVSTSEVLKPINSSAIFVQTIAQLPISVKPFNTSAVMVLAGKDTLRITGSSGTGTVSIKTTWVIRNNLPVLVRQSVGKVSYEAGINSSNGALIVKAPGSVIRVVEGAEPALKKIRDSLRIVVTYDGSDKVLGNIIAPRYRVFMSGFVKVRMGNITFSIDLNYGGTAYLLGDSILVFTTNTVGNLQVGVAAGSNTYCRYLKEPLVTHVKLEAFSTS